MSRQLTEETLHRPLHIRKDGRPLVTGEMRIGVLSCSFHTNHPDKMKARHPDRGWGGGGTVEQDKLVLEGRSEATNSRVRARSGSLVPS